MQGSSLERVKIRVERVLREETQRTLFTAPTSMPHTEPYIEDAAPTHVRLPL